MMGISRRPNDYVDYTGMDYEPMQCHGFTDPKRCSETHAQIVRLVIPATHADTVRAEVSNVMHDMMRQN
jgi:hypothetical protein